jgi:hypothetical protein
LRFICTTCEAVFQSGARSPPAGMACPACDGRMEPEADVLELHGDRTPTRPYDAARLHEQLEAERRAAPAHDDQIWYVGVNGRSVGPLTDAGLEGLVARSQLRRDSLVWRDGWPAWTPAEEVPELRTLLGLPRATPAGDPPALPEEEPA